MSNRYGWIFGAVFALIVLVLAGHSTIKRLLIYGQQTLRGRKTVDERLVQFGPRARARWTPYFQQAGVEYPPGKVTLIGLKQEKRLEVWASPGGRRFVFVRDYPVLAASGRVGPKLREGDRQVPEGFYRIESLNPNSRFHLSLRLNYPNVHDRAQAVEEGRTDPGSDIMIHGNRVSVGCLAMGDRSAEDLFVLAAETGIENVSVFLSPLDFRTTEISRVSHALPDWTGALYENLEKTLRQFTREQVK